MSGPAPTGPTALAVIAKAPAPGRSKTRLTPPFTPVEAAGLAEAALRDTLAAVGAADADRRVVVLDGIPGEWLPSGFEVIAQRGGGLDERLAHAFTDLGGPALIIGMDTPQVTPAELTRGLAALDDAPAVLGPACDGGYWAIGLRHPDPRALVGVPMSTDHTLAAQRSRLRALGLAAAELGELRDVDTLTDAVVVAHEAPGTRFAAALAGAPGPASVDGAAGGALGGGFVCPPWAIDFLERGLEDGRLYVHGEDGSRVALPVGRWLGPLTGADERLLARAVGPVLDVGCGPGRHLAGLDRLGVPALGVDVAPAAVRRARSRGAAAIVGSIFDPLPAAGRWRTALLLDGNIGIGGAPDALLARLRDLLAPAGEVLCELEPRAVAGTTAARVALEDARGRRSRPFPWARVDGPALPGLAARAGFAVLDAWEDEGRAFARLA